MNGFWAIDDFLKDMGNPDASMQGLITAAVPIGFCLCFLPVSWWSDKRGRKEPQIFACVCIVAATFAQTFSYSAWKLFAYRVIIGIGSGTLCTAGPAHILELAHPRQAVQQTALFGSNWFVGYIIASWLTFGCLYINSNWNWRLPSLIQGAPSIIQGVLLCSVPESPRWLFSVGREAEGHAILARYHANGDMDDELVLHQVAEIKATLDVARHAKQVSYLDFLRTKANRKRLFLAVYVGALVQWAGNGLIS
jgi:MFS family permease